MIRFWLLLGVFLPPVLGIQLLVYPYSSQRVDVGFAATTPDVVEAMLKLARVNANDVVYDLGSGDGRIVIMAAKLYGARGVGVELNPSLVKISRQAALENGVADRVSFVEGDLFTADISPATVVTLFLWPSVNKRLEMKLRLELRPGTRIVSNTFGIGNWRPDEMIRGVGGSDVLLWTVPRAPARVPDVPYQPTSEMVAYEMLRLAGATARDVVYDLGSGDGRIPILAAQRYGAQGVGVELDPRLVELSRQVATDARLAGQVTFIEGDLFTTEISKATIVTLYLSETVNAKLESKLRRELRPGTRIVSHQYPLGAWTPDATVRASDGTDLFLWTVR
jgi:predicted RNA methylase